MQIVRQEDNYWCETFENGSFRFALRKDKKDIILPFAESITMLRINFHGHDIRIWPVVRRDVLSRLRRNPDIRSLPALYTFNKEKGVMSFWPIPDDTYLVSGVCVFKPEIHWK